MNRAVVLVLACLVLLSAGCGDDDKPPAGLPSALDVIPGDKLGEVVREFNRGVGLMDQYQPSAAIEAFESVLELAPKWTTARLNLGIALVNANKPALQPRAEAELRRVMREAPGDPRAPYTLGMLLTALARTDEAIGLFQTALALDRDDPDTHLQLGTLLMDRDPKAARAHIEKTVAAVPHHEAAVYRLFQLMQAAGEGDAANRMLARFRQLKDAGAGKPSGINYGEMGKYADVVRAFGKAAPPGAEPEVPGYRDRASPLGLELVTRFGDSLVAGPGVAVSDVDGDGDLDIYVPNHDPSHAGAIYLNDGGRFRVFEESGIDGSTAIGAWFGDYDGDGKPDLYLTCTGRNRLYRNRGKATFEDVTETSGTGGGAVESIGAAWADADHDGDLDLYVCNLGDPHVLWRNNGNGTFTDVATEAGISWIDDSGHAAPVFFDLEGDGDLDLYLVGTVAEHRVLRNDRVGTYVEVSEDHPALTKQNDISGVVVADLDGDGREDLLLVGGGMPRWIRRTAGGFEENGAFAAHLEKAGIEAASGGVAGDLDLDGDVDLFLIDAKTSKGYADAALMNDGNGTFGPPTFVGPPARSASAGGALAVDLDGDGMLEILVAKRGAAPVLWKAPPPEGRHWLTVVPSGIKGGRDGKDDEGRNFDPSGIGLLIEIKAGFALQVRTVPSSTGFLGSAPPRAHFGLGAATKLDYVRMMWPDAVLQSELEVPADRDWRLVKVKRKPSSCPILFTWDGQQFAYITDFLGVGGVGFMATPGVFAPPDPTEDVRIPPGKLVPKDGRLLLRVTEPLEEVTWVDQLTLLAYDHPAGWELYPDERFGTGDPMPTGIPFAVKAKAFPVAARTDKGADVLDRVLALDERYVEMDRDPRFAGFCPDHYVELDFGDRLRKLDPEKRKVLCLHGWIEYTYSHVNYAAYQAGITMQPPVLEVPDGEGGWKLGHATMGFPAGLPRMMTVDVTDVAGIEQGRVRIRTNLEIYWDQVFVAEDEGGLHGANAGVSPIARHVLAPVVADLRYLGYPREYSPNGTSLLAYDYNHIDQAAPFKVMTGDFTRYGDVRELLRDVDDCFVSMAKGDEIALEFDATALPELRAGYARTYVLHTDGFCKDMDLYGAHPETVEPIPYHTMDQYPPSRPNPDPKPAAMRKRYDTRRMQGR